MTAAACALAWFFTFADLEAGVGVRGQRPALVRSEPFADQRECEQVARAVERQKVSHLVYEFEPGRRCFQAPANGRP